MRSKAKAAIPISVLIGFALISLLFSACEKKKEPIKDVKAEESIKKFEDISNNNLKAADALQLIDEISDSLPKVVATVNGVEITNNSIKDALKRLKVQAAHQQLIRTREQVNKIANQILVTEIERTVLFLQGNKLKIEVPDDEIAKVLDQLKSKHKNDDEFIRELTKRGISLKKFKKEVHRNIMVSKLLQSEIFDKIEISDQQVKDYYQNNKNFFKNPETVHAAHILIKTGQGMSDEDKKAAKNKIEDVLKKVKSGGDFVELAKKHSEGPSASRGGDLNYIKKGQMVIEFEEAVFKLKPDEISDVVETQFGYHIIKVYDKKGGDGLLPFNEVSKKISDFLKQSESRKTTKTFIEDLKGKAEIKKFI